MNSYWGLLRSQGVARILISQILARFPSGMIALGLLIHIERIFHSYGSAGFVLGATSMGQAISGPITSRLMGKLGSRLVLLVTSAFCAAALIVLALVPMPLWGYMLVGLLCGLSFPPVQPAARTIYPKLVDSSRLPRLFSLDASAQEIIWVMGPMVITFVSMQIATEVGLLVCAGFVILGGAWFISAPELGTVQFVPTTVRFGAVLKRSSVLLATGIGFMLIGAAAAMEAGIVGRFGEGGVEAGVILATMSLASLLAGFAFGHRKVGRWTLAIWMSLLLAGGLLATEVDGFLGTLLVMGVAGLGIAPALAAMSSMIASTISFSESAEAYGWANTGQLVGAALGSAIAGNLIDVLGSSGGFLTGAAFALVGALLPALFYRVQSFRRTRLARRIGRAEP